MATTASPVRGREASRWTVATPRRVGDDRGPSVITLNFTDAKRVMVAPENGSRFSITMGKAVKACQKMVADEERAKREG